MILKTVTITGADDNVDPYALASMSNVFPFVEWGLLFSKKRQGQARYPSEAWVDRMLRILEAGGRSWPKFSAHLCGQWTRDIMAGDFTFPREQPNAWKLMKRFQLNIAATMNEFTNWSIVRMETDIPCIIQLNRNVDDKVWEANITGIPFFDASGGKGQVPAEWPEAYPGVMNGYGGGLTPDNLADELISIRKAAPTATSFWIDVESGVRTDDKFDLDKVRSFLEVSRLFIEGKV